VYNSFSRAWPIFCRASISASGLSDIKGVGTNAIEAVLWVWEGRQFHKKSHYFQTIFCPCSWQDILPSAFALTVYIQFSLINSFLRIDSRAMGSILTSHGDGHVGINSVKDWLTHRLMVI
jgi:hypothetical protein